MTSCYFLLVLFLVVAYTTTSDQNHYSTEYESAANDVEDSCSDTAGGGQDGTGVVDYVDRSGFVKFYFDFIFEQVVAVGSFGLLEVVGAVLVKAVNNSGGSIGHIDRVVGAALFYFVVDGVSFFDDAGSSKLFVGQNANGYTSVISRRNAGIVCAIELELSALQSLGTIGLVDLELFKNNFDDLLVGFLLGILGELNVLLGSVEGSVSVYGCGISWSSVITSAEKT